MRNYRTGELPDIQISFADILKPLRNVCQRDSGLCRLLLVNLCQAIANEDGQEGFKTQMGQSLVSLLGSAAGSKMTNRTLASAMLEVLVKLRPGAETWANLPVERMATLCRSLNIESLGILALEEKINGRENQPPAAKRRKTHDGGTANLDKADAFGMIDLYKSLGCFASVRGLFRQEEEVSASDSGVATNSIFLCFLLVKTHRFAWRANQ